VLGTGEPGDERNLRSTLSKDQLASMWSTGTDYIHPTTHSLEYLLILTPNPFYYSVHVFDCCYRTKHIIRIKPDIVLQ